MKSIWVLRAILFLYSILLLSSRVVPFSAYVDEEDQKYAESRFLWLGPYPQLLKIVAAPEVAVFLNTSGVCDLKPSLFMKLCEAVSNYKKRRSPYEPYAINETLVPEKCKQYGVKFFYEMTGRKEVTKPPDDYFTTKFHWENKTESRDPVVQARKCPTTKESPKVWLSDGREKRAVFMYIQNTRNYLRLDDYFLFARHLYDEE